MSYILYRPLLVIPLLGLLALRPVAVAAEGSRPQGVPNTSGWGGGGAGEGFPALAPPAHAPQLATASVYANER
jgi:hypothetical protein